MLEHAFGPLGIRAVQAEAVKRNASSVAVLSRLGFVHQRDFTGPEDGEICTLFRLERGDFQP